MVSRTAAEAAVRNVVQGTERGDLLFFIGEQTDDQLSRWSILDTDGDSAIVAFVRRKAPGTVAGLGTTRAGVVADLDVGSAAGAGSLPAATGAAAAGPASMAAGGAAAGVDVATSIGARLAAAVSPSSVCNLRFTLHNGAQLATRFTAQSKALGIRGEVKHMSTSRSDFNLLTAADSDKLLTLVEFMHTLVPVFTGANAVEAPSSSDIPYVVVRSDPAAPLTSDRVLVQLYSTKPLLVSAAPGVQLSLERAASIAEQDERGRQFSLGKRSSSSAQEE